DALAVVHDGHDRTGDRNVHAELRGEIRDRAGGGDALGGAAHLRGGGLDVQPTAQGEAQAVVAAQRGGAGGDQVTHPGEPGEGLAAPAQGHAEPRDLGQPAGDQTGGGVVAVPQAGGGADGDRDDVLHGAGDLDPDHVGGGVGPQ